MTNHILTYLCGTAREVVDLHLDRLRMLHSEGFEIHVCAGDDPAVELLEKERFVVRPFPTSDHLVFHPGALVLVWAHLIENQPTLLHGFDRWGLVAALAARQLAPTATVATFRRLRINTLELPPFIPLDDPSTNDVYAWAGRHLDKVIVFNEADLRTLEPVIDGEKLELLVGGDGVVLPEPQNTIRSSIIVCVTSNLDRRDRAFLDDIQKRVKRRHPRVEWRLVDHAGLPSALTTACLLVDVRQGDASQALMQAAAHSVATISARRPSSEGVVVSGRTGILVEGRATAFTDAIVDLLEHPRLCRELGQAARNRAESRFARHQVDDQLVRLYERLLRRRMGL